jgi:hypothetical protein
VTDEAILRDPEDFSCQVFWSEEDQSWIGIVDELPSLSWVADDRNSADDGIRRLVCRIEVDQGSS